MGSMLYDIRYPNSYVIYVKLIEICMGRTKQTNEMLEERKKKRKCKMKEPTDRIDWENTWNKSN